MPETIPSVEQIHNEVLERSRSIAHDWALLNRLLRYYEPTIRRRWTKKTAKNRQRLLLESWIDMPRLLRPDITAENRSRQAFLWPHITQEALVPKSTLLIFLNSRGRNRPHLFIAADRASAEFGIITGDIKMVSLEDHEVAFFDKTGSGYGELIKRDPSSPRSDRFRMNTGDALLGLEIQERLYKFLVSCAISLLHDVPREQYMSEGLLEEPEPAPIIVEIDLNQSVMATRLAPYRLPTDFDIRRLIALINAKCAATEDHVLALREDPGYFAHVLRERREHRPELLQDLDGRKPFFPPKKDKQLWNRVIRSVLSDAFATLGMWKEMQQQLNSFLQLMKDLPEDLSPEKPLPHTIEQAFCTMIWSLNRMCRFPVENLRWELQSSPHMRPFFRQKLSGNTILVGCVMDKFAADKQRSELLKLVVLLYDRQASSLIGLPTLVDALEMLLQRNHSLKQMISSHVMGTISELSVLTECLREISACQPWAATLEDSMAQQSETLGRKWQATAKGWFLFENDTENPDFVELGAPIGKRFSYPTDKPRSAESTAEMQIAERNLDAFWVMVDAEIRKRNENLCAAIRRNLWDASRSLYRTPDWVEHTSIARERIVPNGLEHPASSQRDIDFELTYRTEGTLDVEAVYSELVRGDVKAKTRGDFQESPPKEPYVQIGETMRERKLTVSRRALEVFRVIFPHQDKFHLPGELEWKDLQKAMAEAGFKQHKLQGSIWQFTHDENGWSIHLHEPHPRPKLTLWEARRIGRRLNRNFGLDLMMFHHKSD